MVNQRDYMPEKIKRIEDQLVRLKQRNDEKEMSILMHQIYHDGKSLSDFEPSELRNLLCYVEEKLKNIREKIDHFEEVLPLSPPPPPMSYGTDSRVNVDEQVLEQQSFLDLVKEVDQVNSGFDNNTGSSMGLPPHANLSDVDMVFPQGNFRGFNSTFDSRVFPPGNFGGLIGGNDSGSRVFLSDNFRGLIGKSDPGSGVFPPSSFGGHIGESKSGSGVLPPGNFGGLNCESDHLGSRVLPQGNFGGLNGESDHSRLLPRGAFIGINVENDSRLLPQGKFRGLNSKSGDHSWVLSKGNFGGLNVESKSVVLPQGNFISLNGEGNSGLLYGSPTGEIGGSDLWQSYGPFGSSIGGSDMTLPYSSSTGNINGTYMGMEHCNENQGGSIENIGLWCPQNKFGANTSEAAMERFNANFVDINYGKNLNPGLPSCGNLASTNSNEGCGIEVPKSFAGNFP